MVGRDAVVDGGGFEFRALLAIDLRQPTDTKNAGMVLEQPAAENLELAARHFFVGGFEQRAQRNEAAEIFVDAVLHLDELGRGDAFELCPGNTAFPTRHGVTRGGGQQQANTRGHPRRPIQPRSGCKHFPSLNDVFRSILARILTAHFFALAAKGAAFCGPLCGERGLKSLNAVIYDTAFRYRS